MQTSNKKLGFTLIELLIVIVIIGILAGVVLAVLNPAQIIRRSRQSSARALLAKACYAYSACYNTSYDATGSIDSSKCDTASEIGVETTVITNAGISQYGGTLGFFTSIPTATTTATCAANGSGTICRPGWRDTNSTNFCGMICETTGKITVGTGCGIL